MKLHAQPYRFRFRAMDRIYFPPGMASNVFRGAFGTILRRIACRPDCPGAKSCTIKADCLYARTFEPRAVHGPSGIRDQPRPFVLRAAYLNGKQFARGEDFDLEVISFDLAASAFDTFWLVFQQFCSEGFGPGRAKAELIKEERLPQVDLILEPDPKPIQRLKVLFLTPMELKGDGRAIRESRFEVLLGRARDRVASICQIYQQGTPQFDYSGMGERAKQVRLCRWETREENTFRKSSRTGLTQNIGGFTGYAEYEGESAEFLPILKAAEWTGVGRMTVWGNGQIRVEAS